MSWFRGLLLATIFLALTVSVEAYHSKHQLQQHDLITGDGGSGAHLKWAKDGHDHAYVNFIDFAGDHWPVGDRITKWDEANKFNVDRRGPNDACGSHCVDVEALPLAPSCGDVGGLASVDVDGDGHIKSSSYIFLNAKCNTAPDGIRAKLTCQELGHVIGVLRHRWQISTCMHQAAGEATQQGPDDHDYNTLDEHIYD